jgi:hypothetical protein
MCHPPLQHGLTQATHNTLGLGSWSTVSYLLRDRPATRTGPRLSATRCARWPLKPPEGGGGEHVTEQHYFILRRGERDRSEMCSGLHVKYPYNSWSIFNETWIFSTDFWQKIPKFQFSWKSVQWESSCSMRTHGRTGIRKLTVAFSNFVNAPKQAARCYFWTIGSEPIWQPTERVKQVH